MKIVQVTHGYPPHALGGVESYTQHLTKALQAQGHELSVFCRRAAAEKVEYSEQEELVDGIAVHQVTYNFSDITGFVGYYQNPVIESIFSRYIERIQPDIIHFQHCIGLSATLLEWTQRQGLPHVVTLHDYWYICPTVHRLKPKLVDCPGTHHPVDCFECLSMRVIPTKEPRSAIRTDAKGYQLLRTLLPWPVRRTLLALYDGLSNRNLPVPKVIPSASESISPIDQRASYMQRLLRASPILLTPSEYVRNAYIDFGVPADLLQVVPLGTNLSPWRERPTARKLGQEVRFGYLGGLMEHKGVELAIRAFCRLDDPAARLKLHGFLDTTSSFGEKISRLCSDDGRIEWMGAYQSAELPSILSQIDVLLIPSIAQETYSFVAREATWAGVPIISTTVGALPELIENEVNGFLLSSRDEEALTNTLHYYFDDPTLWQRQHEAQLQRHVLSIEEQAAQIELVYQQVQTLTKNDVKAKSLEKR